MNPVNHAQPFDVPFHLRNAYEREVNDMADAGILVPFETATDQNTKAFPYSRATAWTFIL